MKNMRFLLVILIIGLSACSISRDSQQEKAMGHQAQSMDGHARNVILLIGDGTATSQISAGIYSQKRGSSSYLRFKNIGFHKSYSASDLITDSAAGATAFSCGVKTYNGAIGVNRDTIPIPTILEEAEKRGMATGLVVTCTIVHATPASFIAHNRERHNYEEIATDFLDTDIDLFIGGGLKYFNERKTDNRNLVQELKNKGYIIDDLTSSSQTMKDITFKKGEKYAVFTAEGHPKKKMEGRDYLPIAVEKTLPFLEKASPNGFFLMIEGSQIDWGGHANDTEYLVTEMVEFDHVIGKVLDWAAKNGETLVVVTGDHECGGFAINPGSERGAIKGGFTTHHHTGALVPVFAYGPGADAFRGIYQNTAIYYKMKEALGMK